jgi:phage repressor protein C with HTH and peptisase S24 domain
MGVSPSAFRKWLKGEAEPSRERLIALARTAGVGVAWLAEGEGPEPSFESNGAGRRRSSLPDPGDTSDWASFVMPPDQTSPPGPGAPTLGRYLALRRDWVRTICGVEPENLALDIGADEAMAPTIRPRDTLLLDTTKSRIGCNGIYVLGVGQQRQVRRVQVRHDGSLLLMTDNQAYQPDIVATDAVAAITVFGRVVWIGRAV